MLDRVSRRRQDRSPETSPPPTYPVPRWRAAVVQFEAVHEECVPALVHLLRLNAVDPVVFLNDRIRTNRPGLKARFPDVADRVRFVHISSRQDWSRVAARIGRLSPDLLIMNTFQNPGPVAWAAEWGQRWSVPLLGVVHNVDLLHGNAMAREMVGEGRVALLTLAPHVTATLMLEDPLLYARTATITSIFPDPPHVRRANPARRKIAVPGRVMFEFRDYQQVLDALPTVMSEVDPASFQLAIVGGGPDRDSLRIQVASAGMADQFDFVEVNDEGFVQGADYYRHLKSAAFLLPLVPPGEASFRSRKITSAIPTALGLGVPPIIDRWTQTVYDVPAVAYRHSEIGGALMRALSMPDDEYADLVCRLEATRARQLGRAAQELAGALGQVGLGV